MTTLGTVPVFLLSSQSVFIRSELDFDEGRFGIAVSAFFGAAAVAALLGGRLADRAGRRVSTIAAGLAVALGGFGVAWGTYSWAVLIVSMVLLGVANAACQVTSNLAVARAVPPHRRGLGFGVKQSAIPVAIMIGGLAVPTVGAIVGWRWTFAFTGAGGLAIAAAGLRLPSGAAPHSTSTVDGDRPPRSGLLLTMAAITLASAAANSLGSFIASWAFHVGLTASQAGLLMAAGSAMNVVARVVTGHLADRRHGRNFPVIASQMVVGAVALALLSVPSPIAIVSAGLLAFALGWSWPGLMLYAVVRIGRGAPGAASGFVQSGAFTGGAAGPAIFGALVGLIGYEAAWRAAAALFLVAATLLLAARRVFIADLEARPPLEPIRYGAGWRTPARLTSAPNKAADARAPDEAQEA